MGDSVTKKLKEFMGILSRKKKFELDDIYKTYLRRCLSTIDLTFIGIGATIGAGIYVLTGNVAKNTSGPAIVLSYLIAGFTSLLSGFCYAEFGSRVPKAGSAYMYCYVALGEFFGFYIGWNMLLEYMIAASSVIKGLSAYIDSLADGKIIRGTIFLIGEIDVPYLSSYVDIFAMVLTLFFTVILSVGVKNSARINNFFVTINILTIVIVIFSGVFYVDKSNWQPFAPYGVKGVLSGAATCFFAFVGFDVIGTAGEEAMNPSKSIPISMTLTIFICFLAYFGVSTVVTMMVPYSQLHGNAAVTDAFKLKAPPALAYVIGIGSMLGLSGCALIHIFPIPRMLYAFAKDGMIFKVFSNLHSDTRVPFFATVSSGIFVGVMAMLLDMDSLVEMLSIGTLFAYTSVDICVLVARYRHEGSDVKNDEVSVHNETTKLLKTQPKNRKVFFYVAILLILLSCYVSSILLQYYSSSMTTNIGVLVILSLCMVLLLCCSLYLACQRQNADNLAFKTPLVPWLPILAIFCNSYLMVSLRIETWIRLGVWFVIGTIVYFTYSIFHSVERFAKEEKEEIEQDEAL